MTSPKAQDGPALKKVIKSRHLFMITLAGVIGTGLFVGTGSAIKQAGPGGTIIAYLIGGLLLYLAMVCLGELSVAMPVSGSFQTHATKFIGPATGFTIGWVYWMSWASFVGLEFVSAGLIMKHWFPHTPTWIWSAVFIVALFTINSVSTRIFAETEYWLAGIKVMAVLAFIILGGLAMFGAIDLTSGPAPQLSNLVDHGGLFPKGFDAVFATVMTVAYTFQGSEVMGVAAGEAENPGKSIPRAVRTIAFRLIVFYLAAILVIMALVPWNQLGLDESPFIAVLDKIGVPYSTDIMNFIILTAILSVGNTGMFICTRILWSLSNDRMAPAALSRITKHGVPFIALTVTLAFGMLSLLSSVIAANTLFVFLISVSGIGGMLTWLAIALSQYKFCRQHHRSGGRVSDLAYAAPLFPVTPLLCIALGGFTFIAMAFDPTQRTSLLLGFGFVAACYVFYYVKFTRGTRGTLRRSTRLEQPDSADTDRTAGPTQAQHRR